VSENYKFFGPIGGSLQNLQVLAGNKFPALKNVVTLNEKFQFKSEQVKVVDALLKSIFELIDNSIDIHEKGNWEFNQLSFNWITNSSNKVIGYEISDNNKGIVVKETKDVLDEPSVRILTEFNAGSNSKEETNNKQETKNRELTFEELNKSVKGRHGVGAVLSSLTAKQTRITNCFEGRRSIVMITKMNPSKLLSDIHNGLDGRTITRIPIEAKLFKRRCKQGVKFEVYPDFNIFNLASNEFDDDHILVVESYLRLQLLNYPKLKLKLNNKTVKLNKPVTSYLSKAFTVGGKQAIPIEFENLIITLHGNSEIGTFMTSNGIFNDPNGKTNKFIGFVEDKLVVGLRSHIAKVEGETVANFTKPSLIKSKFMFYLMIKRISIIKYIDQSKFTIGNDLNDVKTFFELSKVNFNDVVDRLVNSQLYKDWIKSIKKEFKIESLNKRVSKANKLIKESAKLIGDDYRVYRKARLMKRLYVVEGDSAKNALAPHTNRDEDNLLRLTGKIDNFVRKEGDDGKVRLGLDENGRFKNHNIFNMMSVLNVDLNKIPMSEPPFDEIVLASDADDDGTHINILLIVLLCKIYPSLKTNGRLKLLVTPSWVKYNPDGSVADVKYDADETDDTYEPIKGLGTITKELWSFLKVNDSINHLHKPVHLLKEDFNLFIEFLTEDTNLRKELIHKVYQTVKH
jgi:DNA topoisomerase-2